MEQNERPDITHKDLQILHKSILNSYSKDFCWCIRAFASSCFDWFQHQGFWREDQHWNKPGYGLPDTITLPREEYIRLKKAEKIALIHSELSEMLEAVRKGDAANEAEELADTLVRMLDYTGGFNLPLGQAYLEKMEKNFDRPHRHGKAF